MTPQLQRFFWIQAFLPAMLLLVSAIPWSYYTHDPWPVLLGAIVSVSYFFLTTLVNIAVFCTQKSLPFNLMYASFLVGPVFLFLARTRLDYAVLVPVILLHVLLAGWQQGRIGNNHSV